MLVNIPMYGTVESLNVSVASGMVLAESRRQPQVAAGQTPPRQPRAALPVCGARLAPTMPERIALRGAAL